MEEEGLRIYLVAEDFDWVLVGIHWEIAVKLDLSRCTFAARTRLAVALADLQGHCNHSSGCLISEVHTVLLEEI